MCETGGADTDSLCGREMSWDIPVDTTPDRIQDGVCSECAEQWKEDSNWERDGDCPICERPEWRHSESGEYRCIDATCDRNRGS